MSLADELLADLEDDEEMAEEVKEELEEMDIKPSKLELEMVPSTHTIHDVARLINSDRLRSVMTRMDEFAEKPRKPQDLIGVVEADPEYLLIVEANNLAADIDHEMNTVHKYARDVYTKRFPELESLVVQPLEYLMTAKELKNELENVKNNETLLQYLTQATIMVVSVTASTTQGKPLNKEELDIVESACDMAIELAETKRKIFEYVESRMAFIAPNLSAIIGANIAAKLLGAAGGLTNLSKMPANNISLLGQQKKVSTGFSTATQLPHTGFIYYSQIVQDVPPDLRRKVARLVGTKCTLAARVDSFHQSTDGHVGLEYKEELEKKVDKLVEPPPVKNIRALKAPMDAPKKKRGGRRVRQMKERYAVTELRKQANRMTFGELEDDSYQSDLGATRGNIGKGGIGGGIRMAQVDERTKVRISQTLKKNLQKQQAVWGGMSSIGRKHTSGTASSVAFTPVQGLEIVNPVAMEKKVAEANAKYFSATSGFRSVKKMDASYFSAKPLDGKS
ncbi:U4/U6 small nuclear ribonucleoprotein Prp31 [Eurytemora carolleeae]|uniref:U4/U6 small nuclear ribonucleoprotein Prp31 n=1 Tax=Eurytemora carolleeae TaxID=1294199 RepID=UPI000C78BE73|nr:U4/U6 small nuclear ribonucleoprotein Prp31 [Eurytemora carolleeae]|eukprot:XP_023329470.1 U4/U6 small nuclear ribonucleoprotein Prp31-like [Eurytemora affinis]